MSVREEDRQKSTCTSRGLGLAAAAIGVGVGAAMYYFFSKRPEHPHNEGSTTEWNCERETFNHIMDSEDSYTTVSEYDTTDTSINQSASSDNCTASEESEYCSDSSDEDESSDNDEYMEIGNPGMDYNSPSLGDMTYDSTSPESHNFSLGDMTYDSATGDILGDMTYDDNTQRSDSDSSMGDVTYRHYINYNIMTPMRQALNDLKRLFDVRNGKAQDEHAKLVNLRQQAFRERTWTLEECSICFDVMLRNQEVMSLPCTHNFHTGCILPWLQEKQTCPVCRKNVD